jgi:hypothetical protein
VKEEVRALLQRSGVATMRMMPVRRSYAFENRSVPHGEQWVLKVRPPAATQMPTAVNCDLVCSCMCKSERSDGTAISSFSHNRTLQVVSCCLASHLPLSYRNCTRCHHHDLPFHIIPYKQVRYPANLPALSATSGASFVAVFGAAQSPLEALLVKRAIKGPGWLGIEQARRTDFGNQSTWTKVRCSLGAPAHERTTVQMLGTGRRVSLPACAVRTSERKCGTVLEQS